MAEYQGRPSAFLGSESALYGLAPLSNQHKGATIWSRGRGNDEAGFSRLGVSVADPCERDFVKALKATAVRAPID